MPYGLRTCVVVVLCACLPAIAEEAGYEVVRGFLKPPPGLTLGAVSGVATDSANNVYLVHRGDPAKPVLVFDRTGAFLRSFGEGLFVQTHGLRIDPDGNVWATDSENHTVVKFSPDGKVLMTLGERDVKGEDERHFNRPTDIAFAKNGDVYVSDGYGNSRVVKLDKSGKFLLAWGRKGTGPGEFDTPHQVRLDSKGDVYIADRENKRIQVFTPDGKFVRQFGEGIAPYGLFITPKDEIFVADGLKHEVVKLDGSGKVLFRWGAGGREPGNFFLPHGLNVGADGAVYVGEITNARMQKFVPAAGPQAGTHDPTKARSDWPQFRGSGGTGIAAGRAAPTKWGPEENIRWKIQLPGAGASSPVIAGDRIFLTAYTGHAVPGSDAGDIRQLRRQLLCFDRATGRQLWSREVEARQPEQEKVREDHGYSTNTPAVDEERVYAFFGKSGVYAFDHGGNQRWRADVGSRTNGWGSAASPVISGEMLIVNASVESESIVALDRKTGAPAWRADGIRDAWNAPILVDVPGATPPRELVLAMFQKVLGLDPATGAKLWSCDTGINWYMVPGLVADADGVVYCIGGRTGGALAVRAGGRGDVTASHRLWTGTRGSNVSSPVLAGDHLYWAHENRGEVYCAKAKTGEILYEQRLDRAGQIYASPVLSGGNLYYTTRDGRTFVVAAAPQFKLLATNELERRGTFNASPAVADGCLYIRSNRHLYCIAED